MIEKMSTLDKSSVGDQTATTIGSDQVYKPSTSTQPVSYNSLLSDITPMSNSMLVMGEAQKTALDEMSNVAHSDCENSFTLTINRHGIEVNIKSNETGHTVFKIGFGLVVVSTVGWMLWKYTTNQSPPRMEQ